MCVQGCFLCVSLLVPFGEHQAGEGAACIIPCLLIPQGRLVPGALPAHSLCWVT